MDINLPVYRKALLERGRILHAIGNLNQSSVALNKAVETHLSVNDTLGAEDSLVELGILFSQIGLYDEEYFRSRCEFVKPKPLTRALDLVNLGRNILLQSRYQEAVNYYQKSLAYCPFEGGSKHYNLFAYNGLIEGLFFFWEQGFHFPIFPRKNQIFYELGRPVHFTFLLKQSRFLTQLVNKQYQADEKDGIALFNEANTSGDVSDLILSARFLSELYRQTDQMNLALKYNGVLS